MPEIRVFQQNRPEADFWSPSTLNPSQLQTRSAIRDVANGLLQGALSGDTASAIFYLKTQAGWRETDRLEHKVSGAATLTVVTGVPRADDK